MPVGISWAIKRSPARKPWEFGNISSKVSLGSVNAVVLWPTAMLLFIVVTVTLGLVLLLLVVSLSMVLWALLPTTAPKCS